MYSTRVLLYKCGNILSFNTLFLIADISQNGWKGVVQYVR